MRPAITPSTATVWLADLRNVDRAQLDAFAARLSDSEAARYGRFVRPVRQRQFLVGRMLLRQAVGALLGVAPDKVSAQEQPGRAPRLTLAGSALAPPFFSLSHSGHWVACAVSTDTALGLDIEMADPRRDIAALAGQAFDDAACAALLALPAPQRVAAFYQMWCAMEARIKLGAAGDAQAGAAPDCVSLPHAELSIVLCSAQPLATAPRVEFPHLD